MRIIRRFLKSLGANASLPWGPNVPRWTLCSITWGWWRLCDVLTALSAQESGDGMGTHSGRPLGTPQIFQQNLRALFLCVTLEHLFLMENLCAKNLRIICAFKNCARMCANICAPKSVHQKSAEKEIRFILHRVWTICR